MWLVSPTTYQSRFCQHIAINSLVPHHRLAIVLREDIAYSIKEVLLELMTIFEALLLHQLLAIGTRLPTIKLNLIAADVIILLREYLDQLFNDILDKSVV